MLAGRLSDIFGRRVGDSFDLKLKCCNLHYGVEDSNARRMATLLPLQSRLADISRKQLVVLYLGVNHQSYWKYSWCNFSVSRNAHRRRNVDWRWNWVSKLILLGGLRDCADEKTIHR